MSCVCFCPLSSFSLVILATNSSRSTTITIQFEPSTFAWAPHPQDHPTSSQQKAQVAHRIRCKYKSGAQLGLITSSGAPRSVAAWRLSLLLLWWCEFVVDFFASTSVIFFLTFCLQCCFSGSVDCSRNVSLLTRDICPLVVFLNVSPFLLTQILFVCSRLCAAYVVPSTRFRSILCLAHFVHK